MSSGFSGTEELYSELKYWSMDVDTLISEVLSDTASEGAEYMQSVMAKDTGYLQASMFQDERFLFAEFGTRGTNYAGVNDGMVPVDRPYTTTPFFNPSVEFVDELLQRRLSDIQKGGMI